MKTFIAACLFGLLYLVGYGGFIYVAVHFIAKYW